MDKLYSNPKEKAILKDILDNSLFAFTAYFFNAIKGETFIENWHHHWICSILEAIHKGELGNTIINTAPGASKTVAFSIMFPLWCFAKNPQCRFIEVSYSDELVEANSAVIKDVIESDAFKDLYPGYGFKQDSDKKKEWTLTYMGKSSGEFLAAGLFGKITGKRAGFMKSGFSGAILIDDPLKPIDAFSDANRNKANDMIYGTLRSRKANPNVPMIMIMQRLHEEDPTGFLLSNCSFDNWTHICIPAEIDQDYFDNLPEAIKEIARPSVEPQLKKYGRASYWAYKEPLEELDKIRAGSSYNFMSQYMQKPTPKGGTLIQTSWFKSYDTLPIKLDSVSIIMDTAVGVKTHNDYSVMMAVGEFENNIYIIDIKRGKWEMPQLILQAKQFCSHIINKFQSSLFKGVYIEFKASGQGLVQMLRNDTRLPIIDVTPKGDKVLRVNQIIPYLESGRCYIPSNASWLGQFIDECASFSPMMTQKHDDQVDCLVYALWIAYIEHKQLTIHEIYF